MKKIAIIHFQPLEKYPPVMNLINSITAIDKVSCNIYTTHHKNNNWFTADKVDIKRVAKQYQNSLLRYWCYIKFNVITFFSLMIKQPKVVVAFETYSLFPTYLYKKIFSKVIIILHYHEYVSLPEINNSSAYTKFLHLIENKLSVVCNCISQTNNERLQLYLKDYPFINPSITFVIPNFPPSRWYEFAKLNKKNTNVNVIKLVHVGAVSLKTMHTKKMLEWVIAQNGKYKIDFYTDNIETDAKKLFDSMNNENINLLGSINYFQLPKILINYDIGLTLYNGHIPNYVCNIPNKVLEYLACGLQVWFSSELISTQKFIEDNSIKGCIKIDFERNIDIRLNANFLHSFNDNISFQKLLTAKSTLFEHLC